MIKDIEQEAKEIQAYLEITCSENPVEMVERLSILNVYMARTGVLLADAIRLKDAVVNALFRQEYDRIKGLSPSVAKEYINSCAADENRLVVWLDRLNKACTHHSENFRTMISFAKQQMDLERRGY